MYNNFDKLMHAINYAFDYDLDNFNIDFGMFDKLMFKNFFINDIDIIKIIRKNNYVKLLFGFKDIELIKELELFCIKDFYDFFENVKSKDFDIYESI